MIIKPLRTLGYTNSILILGEGSEYIDIPFISLAVPNLSEIIDQKFRKYLN